MTLDSQIVAHDALPLLDSEVMRSFVTVAELGSFSRAADRLFRTPSALSMQIKRLEETLGRTLFIRDARRTRLTADGDILLDYARRLLQLNAEAVARFVVPTLRGRVGFGMTDDMSSQILPDLLAQFARLHPAVQVDVVIGTSSTLLARLDSGELDVVLVNHSPANCGRGLLVHSAPLDWVAREGGMAARRSPLPLALAQPGCSWRKAALDALADAGIDYRIAYSCEHCSGQQAAMLADLAVAPFPRSLIRAPLRRVEQPVLPPLGDYQMTLVRGSSRNDACETLAGEIQRFFRD